MDDIKKTYDTLPEEYLNIAKIYLSTDEATMDAAIRRHSAVYAFFGSVLSYAKKENDLASLKLEMTEADSKEKRRAEKKKSGEKVTEGSLNAYVMTVPEIVGLREKQLDTQHKYHLAKNIVTSLEHQKDMLIQMSANKRAEVRLHEL